MRKQIIGAILILVLLAGCKMPAPVPEEPPIQVVTLPAAAPQGSEPNVTPGESRAGALPEAAATQPAAPPDEDAATAAPTETTLPPTPTITPVVVINTPASSPTAAPASLAPATAIPPAQAGPAPTATAAVQAALPVISGGAALDTQAVTVTRFLLQRGTPILTQNFARPESGCNYMGIAGQAFGLNGSPAMGLVVEVRGTLNGQSLVQLGLTGSSTTIGPGGYEILLAQKPADTKKALTVQLLDLNGKALSDRIAFDTSAACEKNLALVNFVQAPTRFYFPMVRRNR